MNRDNPLIANRSKTGAGGATHQDVSLFVISNRASPIQMSPRGDRKLFAKLFSGSIL